MSDVDAKEEPTEVEVRIRVARVDASRKPTTRRRDEAISNPAMRSIEGMLTQSPA
jgi:hypothetical protein